jgi:hypothetical protein
MAGKRSNPVKMFRDRAAIMLDKAGRAYDEAVARKRRRKNPPPVIEGARVTGFKRPRSDA